MSSDDSDTAHAPTAVATPGDTPTAASVTPLSRSSRPQLAVGEQLGERYTVREFLGAGGMGAVYRAFDQTLGEDVALKVVRGADAAHIGLRDEVRLAQRVTHRNVCRTYDLEEVGERHFVKMEYIAGETLAARLSREGKLPVAEAVRIARGVADGLAAAHAEGIVHRDLKPGNVMLAKDRVVLMDFGLALRPGADETDRSGTPGYMSPEQLAGRAVDARSDLYALGCVLYEMLTKTRVADQTDVRVLRPETPRWLAHAVDDLLALEPAHRRRGERLLARGPRSWKLAGGATTAVVAAGVVIWQLWPPPVRADWHPDVRQIGAPLAEDSNGVSISPDGKLFAYDSNRGSDWGIYTEPVGGGSATRVSPLPCTHPRWSHDGTQLWASCGGSVFRISQFGAAPTPHWKGILATPCGGDVVVIQDVIPGHELVRIQGSAVDSIVAGEPAAPIDDASCDDSGTRIAYITGDPGALWLREGSGTQELAHDVEEVRFAQGGRSLVYSQHQLDHTTDLFEYVLATKTTHRLTTGAHAHAPEVAPDGSTLVYIEDRSSTTLFEQGASGRQERSLAVKGLEKPALTPDGRYLVADNQLTKKIVVIDRVDGSLREIGDGDLLSVTSNGNFVMYVSPDTPEALRYVPLVGRGLAPSPVVFPQSVVRALDGRDGTHVELADGLRTHAWLRTFDGQLIDEGVGGLVIPARVGGWRLVREDGLSGVELHIVPPDHKLDDATFGLESTAGWPAWLGEHELAYCDSDACYRFDVAERRVLETIAIQHDPAGPLVAAPDGKRFYGLDGVARVARMQIANFGARPWAPRR